MPMPEARWVISEVDAAAPDRLCAALGVDSMVAHVLVNRGYDTPEKARRFLDAPLDALADPDKIADMPVAADRIAAAISAGELLAVFGDYDADGVSATSILVRGLSALGGRMSFYIPSRFTEGYGLNDAALTQLAAGGARLIIAVDCGVTAVDEVRRAREREQEIIVVDHHEPPPALPDALAVIDPKRRDRASPFREYCAAGLAFQLLRAVRHRLGHPEMPVELLDRAALGTIADVVPLIDDNRILAQWGLARMTSAPGVGLAALIRVAGLTGEITARHVGFAIAPRLNAAGRLGDASQAVRLLLTDDPAEAETIAINLDQENQHRRVLCDQILAQAVQEVESTGRHLAPAIVLAAEGWHAGVIGIVASQLVERYYRPVVLMAVDQGVGKGSARSIAPFHMVDALSECADMLVRFGGHAMAAGLTITADRVPEFIERFTEVAAARLSPDDLVPSLAIDAEVSLGAITESLAKQLQQLAPYGAGNPEPVLAVRGLQAVTTSVMGDGVHLRLGVTDGHSYAEAVGFRLGDASELLAFTRARIDLAFSVGLDRWDARNRVQLIVQDLKTPGLDLTEVLTDSRLLVDRLFARAEDYLRDGALGLEEAGAFYTKVVGVTFEGRQQIVQTLQPGDSLILRREPDNPHDPHAVKVVTAAGAQVGYLSSRVAARVAPSMDTGARYSATASQVTGGGERSYGVNIYIQRQDRPSDEPDPAQGLRLSWRALPAAELVDRLRVHLHRARTLRPPQLEAIHALLAGRSILGVFGPGRGRRIVIELVAAASVIAGRGPVVITVPLQSQVDSWGDRLVPHLAQVGIRCARAHGALLFRQRQRLLDDLRNSRVDVLLASLEYLRHQAGSPTGIDVRGLLHPALLVVDGEPTIDRNSLEQIGDALGRPQRAVLCGATEHAVTALWDEPLTPVVDSFLRIGVRLVDRREPADRDGALAAFLERKEKTLICTGSRTAAVEVARRLRDRTGAEVAYYHRGLPLRVREVLEQMFADGKVPVLVAADGLTEESAPSDIRHVVAAGLPDHKAELAEWIGMAGLDGRSALATLLYRRDDARAVEEALAEYHPTRETLAAIYRAVRDQVERATSVLWPDETLASALEGAVPSRRTIGIGLDVLAEAGVIQREFDGDHWRITLGGDGSRRDLTTSLRYAEGQRQAEALADLTRWAFGPLHQILKVVAGPGTREPGNQGTG